MGNLTRRRFVQNSLLTGGALAVPRSVMAASAAIPARPTRLTPVGYEQVRLLDGPLREQFDRNHAFFLALSEDSLLKPFRQKAGLPAPGDDMGGWYTFYADFSPKGPFHGYIPGHSFGQYVSGLARAYAQTGSKPTQQKVHRLVDGFSKTITPKFYIDYHLPAYTFDKTCCGLIDAHAFAQDPVAMHALGPATDAVIPFLPGRALNRKEMYARRHKDDAYCWDETYTLPENLFLAYQRSGETRYRAMAKQYIEDESWFTPLSEDQNVLPGQHAYSHLNSLCSAMQSYLNLNDERYLRAARNGFRMVEEQSFATGGWGPNETFVKPGSTALAESLTETHAGFETPCGAYGHFKITRYLLLETADSRYGDSMERVLYNTILGAKPLQLDGTSFYYSDYNDNAQKGYFDDKWPCCSGTFPQITADYGISAYMRRGPDVYVNLYVPSELRWRQGGAACMLTQTTEYPASSQSTMVLTLDRPQSFAVLLRVPAWAGAKTRIAVNGRAVDGAVQPGTFARVQRRWKSGDRIEVEFDMPLRLETIPYQQAEGQRVALMYGPVALFAVGDLAASVTRTQLLAAERVSKSSTDWSSMDWKVATAAQPLTMRPFAAIGDEHYRLYQMVMA
jgi:uncharacterized protein